MLEIAASYFGGDPARAVVSEDGLLTVRDDGGVQYLGRWMEALNDKQECFLELTAEQIRGLSVGPTNEIGSILQIVRGGALMGGFGAFTAALDTRPTGILIAACRDGVAFECVFAATQFDGQRFAKALRASHRAHMRSDLPAVEELARAQSDERQQTNLMIEIRDTLREQTELLRRLVERGEGSTPS